MKMLFSIIKSKRFYFELAAVALISLFPRLFGIQRFLWKDELISLRTLDVDILQNPLLFGATTNLPFFFYVLKLFNAIFSIETFWIYRALPVIFGIAAILVVFLFLSKVANKKVAWFSAIIMALSPLQVYYSQELRPYSLIQLLIILNAVFLYLYLQHKRSRDFLIFALSSILIVFTHYTGYYFLLAEGLLLAALIVTHFIKYKTLSKETLKSFFVLLFSGALGLTLLYLMSQNPLFTKSIELLEIGGRWNPLNNIFGETYLFLTRLKEVLTFYYWFGLYYYSVDPAVQYVFKKAIAVLIAIFLYIIYANIKGRFAKETLVFFFAGLLLLISLFLSYLGEKLGYFPFGGRHIMPYSVFFYVIVAYVFSKLKFFGTFLFVLLILILSTYQFCFIYGIPADQVFITIPANIFRSCASRLF